MPRSRKRRIRSDSPSNSDSHEESVQWSKKIRLVDNHKTSYSRSQHSRSSRYPSRREPVSVYLASQYWDGGSSRYRSKHRGGIPPNSLDQNVPSVSSTSTIQGIDGSVLSSSTRSRFVSSSCRSSRKRKIQPTSPQCRPLSNTFSVEVSIQ